ncbi:hypothetical protein FKW77_005114 [Venturia effusa]|uniref:Uncharacterized protein n=1 Tax=Venturia effusa TaxID=50376 RepID=A0A517LQ68_9PEZI|nr:hypothetical protein FKW77_005114 [Venturia effusa]
MEALHPASIMEKPPHPSPPKPKTTFLTLPRELRQKIIFEAYSSLKLVYTLGNVPETLLWARGIIQKYPMSRGISFSTPSNARSYLIEFLEMIEILTNDLERVHEDIVDDVDYVTEKLKWTEDIEALVEQLNEIIRNHPNHFDF